MGKAWYLGHLSAQDAELGGSDGKSHCTFRNKAAGCDVGSLHRRSGVQRESRRKGQPGDLTEGSGVGQSWECPSRGFPYSVRTRFLGGINSLPVPMSHRAETSLEPRALGAQPLCCRWRIRSKKKGQ